MFRMRMELSAVVLILAAQACAVSGVRMPRDLSSNIGRSLEAFQLEGLYEGCPQGPQGVNSIETMTNPPDWWETNWGRTDDAWPRRGTQECWDNRGDVCALPDRDHIVCLPGSKRGSTVNKGWALDPKSESCQPGVRCLYACEPGYYWTMFNQSETSNYDYEYGPKMGHCDGTWDYGTSTHGIYCKEDGTLDLPEDKPLCQLGEDYVFAENHLDTHVFLCQTVFPGHEIFLIPTLVKPGESVMITTQPADYWHGPTYQKPTHGDFYLSFSGADIMEACTWDEISPSGASMLPYEVGNGVEDNGFVYSTHYFYQQPNSEIPQDKIGYQLDLQCESSEPGVCGPVFRNADVVKVDVLRKPAPGTTKVKFVFTPEDAHVEFPDTYREPNHNFLDPTKIPDPEARSHYGVVTRPAPVHSTTPTVPTVPTVPSVPSSGAVDGKESFPDPDTTNAPAPVNATPTPRSSPRRSPQVPVVTSRPAPQVVPQQPQPPAVPTGATDAPNFGHAVCIDGVCYQNIGEYLDRKAAEGAGGTYSGSKGMGDVHQDDVSYVASSLQGSGALQMGRR